MADLSRKTASIYINHAPAEEALKSLQKQADTLQEKIKAGEAAGKSMVNEIKKLNTVKGDMAAVQKQIDSGLRPSFNQLQTTVAKLRNELKRMSEDAPGYAEKFKAFNNASTELSRLQTNIRGVNGETSKLGQFFGSFSGILGGVGIAAAGAAVLGFFKGAADEAIQASEASEKLQTSLENAGHAELFENLRKSAADFHDTFKAIDDDDIVEQVFTKLVDFGKLSEDQIKQITPVIIDFAQKEKISLAESTDVLIDGLNGKGKALNRYGVAVKEGADITERFSILTEQLGNKVKGAQEKFESGPQGALAKFKQRIKDIQESIGAFVVDLLKASKSADQLFDEAKSKTEQYEKSLTPLITRYDELKTKTTLNKDEQTELHGIIQKIALIVPTAVKELDKYGSALDINRGKVTGFLTENAKFLRTKEASAVSDLQEEAKQTVDDIEKAQKEFDTHLTVIDLGEGTVSTTTATLKEDTDRLASIAASQGKLVDLTDKLINKYKVDLPAGVQKARDAIISTYAAVAAADKNLPNSSGTALNPGKKEKTPEQIQAEKDAEAEAKRKAKEAIQRAKELQKELADLQKSITDQYNKAFLDDLRYRIKKIDEAADAELAQLQKLLANKIITQTQFNDLSLDVERIRVKNIQDLNKKLADDLQPNKTAPQLADRSKGVQVAVVDASKDNKDAIEQHEVNKIGASTSKRLDEEKKILDLQKAQELTAKDLTENQKLLIEEKYRQKRADLEKQFITEQAQKYIDGLQQALDFAQVFNAAADARDQQRIDDNNAKADKDKQKAKKQLDDKLIDQAEYDRRVRAIDLKNRKETAKLKRQQFERDKRAEIIQAEISGAQAILSALKTSPFWLGLILAGVATVKTFEQINAIKQKKAPDFARGGYLDGPAHSNGGMPVINPNTGRKVAEVEGGEVILSKKTVRNNNQLISELLQSSMYGNGATIKPFWKTRPYVGMNYGAINRSIQNVKHYDRGGVFAADDTRTSQPAFPIAALMNSIDQLTQRLETPFKAYTVISEANAANETLDNIRNETTMSRVRSGTSKQLVN